LSIFDRRLTIGSRSKIVNRQSKIQSPSAF
jgi:hypothetical protein